MTSNRLEAHDCRHHSASEKSSASPLDASALISARALSVRRGGRTLLDHVDIDIRPGEIVTLIGPNGAGKTTLARVLLGLERPDTGTVRRSPGLRVGYVPQRFDIDPVIPMTADGFLRLGHDFDRTPQSPIVKALSDVGADHVISRQLSQLSGGELQRVTLARALLRDPNLLVLDEPARGVDYAGEAELYTLIGELRRTRDLGVLLISHDLHIVMAQSDRVICLNRHVCCEGVPEAVARHPEYARLFGAEIAAPSLCTSITTTTAMTSGASPIQPANNETSFEPAP